MRTTRPKLARLLPGLVVAFACAACATGPTATPSTAPASVAATPGSSQPSSSSSAPHVAIDPALLRLLPDSVDGLQLVEARDAEAEGLGQPNLGQIAASLAASFAATPESGDFVYAVVVALRPGAMSDSRFRSWRDTFDEGACSQAGGVTGNAEAEIAGRKTYIGTCAGGLHTYHVWLPNAQRIVSISALGDRRLGEQVLRNLRE
jgi:hypothetical protein